MTVHDRNDRNDRQERAIFCDIHIVPDPLHKGRRLGIFTRDGGSQEWGLSFWGMGSF